MSEPKTYRATVEVSVDISVTDPDVIERVTGPGGDEWRSHLYNFETVEDVIKHLAFNAVQNNVTTVAELDGWADLPHNAALMFTRVEDIEVSS